MPSKTTKKKPAALPSIPKEVIDHFVSGPSRPDASASEPVYSDAFRISSYSSTRPKKIRQGNRYRAALKIPKCPLFLLSHSLHYANPEVALICRSLTSFEPLLISRHERLVTGFADKIVVIFARGMTIREIQGFLVE